MIFFQLFKTSLKLRKREFYWPKFSCLTNKKFIFSVKSKQKKFIINTKYFEFQHQHVSKSTDELPGNQETKAVEADDNVE